MAGMQMMNGKVTNGRIELPAGTVPDGTTVTILLPDQGARLELSPIEKEALMQSIAQAERGETTDGWELLERLSE